MSSTIVPPSLTITTVNTTGGLMSTSNTSSQVQALGAQQQGGQSANRVTIAPLSVKQERHDEAEIQEMANKFREAQKAAMAKQTQQQQQQLAGRQVVGNVSSTIGAQQNGQTNILNYLTRKSPQTVIGATGVVATPVAAANGQANAINTVINGKAVPANAAAGQSTGTSNENGADKKTCDEESQKGHFGWVTFGKIFIPYIVRQNEKYCAVRMVEMKLLNKYLSYLHPDIYSSCTCVRSYYITEAESRLLNEINHKHCDAQFGREMFTLKDLVVRLSDANKFYQFLDICYRKLVTGSKSPSDKCGFIRINKESVVPYTVRANEQVVPLFYFEGETENLRQKAELLSGWDLAYLKFCCKVQGIRNELFSSESVAVISLTDIKSYFPTGTEFEDYWPSKVVDSNLLIASKNINNSVHWTRQPTAPPVTPKILNTVPKPTQQQQQQIRKNAYQTGMANQNAVQRMHQTAAASMTIPQTTLTPAAVQAWSMAYAQGTLRPGATLTQNDVRMIQAQQHQVPRTYTGLSTNVQNIQNLQNMMTARQQYTNYNSRGMAISAINNCPQTQHPPPLVRSASQNQQHMSNAANVVLQQQQQQPQQQQQQQQLHRQQQMQQQQLQRLNTMQNGRTSTTAAANPIQRHTTNASVTEVGVSDVIDPTLRVIPELTTQSVDGPLPYKVQKVFVFDDTLVPCINMKAYNDSDPLMTLMDFRDHFFPNVPWTHCKRLIEALGVEMYRGNREQTLTLMESGKIHNLHIPLIQVRDVIKYMPQLRYMMRGSQIGQDQPPNKRTRIS